MSEDQLRYPIGKFKPPLRISPQDREQFLLELEVLPAAFNAAVAGLTDEQLDTPYRPEGWTVRQLVHHVPESHLNSYIRFKWAITEPQPTIKAYNEKDWASLTDATQAPIDLSLGLLASLHKKWVYFLRTLSEEQWKRSFLHPENNKLIPLDLNLALYAWHGKHHLAHIRSLKERKGWVN